MQFAPDKAIRKVREVRNNIDRLFDKNLTDLIRGIRNNKENEARYIAACIEEIKVELRQDSPFVKANAVEKLSYLQMLGYDISWACFNIVEVMASSKFSEKRIGYVAATQSFNDDTDVLMLTTNLVRKDLQSSNMYDVGEALSGLACFATPDLARDLVNDVVNLLSSSRTYVRKKAVLLLYKIFLKYPESLRPTFPRLKEKLEDPDPGVQSAAVNVICELSRKNPKNYLSLAPVFFKLMTGSSNNWMLIKLIKLFGSLVPLEARLGKKLLEPLTNLINSTSAMSLLYECINTVIAVLISISSEGPGDYTPSIQLCVQKLGVLIEDSDQNLKYLGLLAMGRILSTHPKAVQAHKDIVMRCLDDKDESIRLRALDLLYGMVSKKNIMEIVKKLMEHVDAAEGSFYRDELLSRIIAICSHNNYQYITNFEWYISVLVELTRVEGTKHGALISEQILDVTVRVSSIRHFSVSQMALLLESANLLLAGNSAQKGNICEVLLSAAWICGEYSEHLSDVRAVLEAMLRAKLSIYPGSLISVYVQDIAKLYNSLLNKFEAEDDWDEIESLDNFLLSKLPEFQYTEHLEAQERACNLVEILRHVERCHSAKEKVGEAFAALIEGDMNPIARKAQRKVPIPEGLDLDAWINTPEPDSEVESESEESFSGSPPAASHATNKTDVPQPNGDMARPSNKRASKKVGKSTADEVDIEESRRRRRIEQESNPYYMKATVKDQSPKLSAAYSVGKPPGAATLSEGTEKSHLVASSTAQLDSTAFSIQNPLEIPGMIGLGRYLEQQNSTLSWKQAKEKGAPQRRKRREKLNDETSTTSAKVSKGKRGKQKNLLSALSSSDEEGGTQRCPNRVVVHHVNKDDGEMPDNALSSLDEEDRHLNNEFRALDVDLDQPLREDERLFAPKAYSPTFATQPTNLLATASGHEASTKKKKKQATGESCKAKKAKNSSKKAKSTQQNATERVDGNAKQKNGEDAGGDEKKKRRRRKRSIEEYTAIKSSNEGCAGGGGELGGEILSLAGSPEKSEKGPELGVLKAHCNQFCENDDLKITYGIDPSSGGTNNVTLAMGLFNKRADAHLSQIELNFLPMMKSEISNGEHLSNGDMSTINQDGRVLVPFELAPTCSGNISSAVLLEDWRVLQRVRGSISYVIAKELEDKRGGTLDFIFKISPLHLLKHATISSESFEYACGELPAVASKKFTTNRQFSDILAEMDRRNFFVVEENDLAVSLYAHDWEGESVCFLLKQTSSTDCKATYTIHCKCTSDATASAIMNEICDNFARKDANL